MQSREAVRKTWQFPSTWAFAPLAALFLWACDSNMAELKESEWVGINNSFEATSVLKVVNTAQTQVLSVELEKSLPNPKVTNHEPLFLKNQGR